MHVAIFLIVLIVYACVLNILKPTDGIMLSKPHAYFVRAIGKHILWVCSLVLIELN
jgi:hypothetical protein